MKIGLLVSYNRPEELEKGFYDLAAYGFDNCQLCSWNPAVWTDENAQKVRALAERYHVTVSAFWCGWEGPAFLQLQRDMRAYSPLLHWTGCFLADGEFLFKDELPEETLAFDLDYRAAEYWRETEGLHAGDEG